MYVLLSNVQLLYVCLFRFPLAIGRGIVPTMRPTFDEEPEAGGTRAKGGGARGEGK